MNKADDEGWEKGIDGIAHLLGIPLLEGLSADELRRIASVMKYRRVAKGVSVVQKGERGEHLIFVVKGRLQAIDLTEDGKEVGLNFLDAGDYFGELSIIDDLPRSATVIACQNSLIALMSRTHAKELIYETPLVVERVLKRLAASIRKAANYRTILGMPSAFQRVFAIIDQMAAPAPGGLVVIERLPAQQEMAIMVNTSRETVSRALHVLLQKGIVEKDLRRLIIRQPESLHKAAFSEDGSA